MENPLAGITHLPISSLDRLRLTFCRIYNKEMIEFIIVTLIGLQRVHLSPRFLQRIQPRKVHHIQKSSLNRFQLSTTGSPIIIRFALCL